MPPNGSGISRARLVARRLHAMVRLLARFGDMRNHDAE